MKIFHLVISDGKYRFSRGGDTEICIPENDYRVRFFRQYGLTQYDVIHLIRAGGKGGKFFLLNQVELFDGNYYFHIGKPIRL